MPVLPHIDPSWLICIANQLTGFYMSAALAFNELSNWNMDIEAYYKDNGYKWIFTYTLKTFEASTKCWIYFIGRNGFSFMWCIKVAKHVEGFRNYIFRFQVAFFMWLGLKNSGNILFFIYLNPFVSDAPFLYPMKTENLTVDKVWIGNKWVNICVVFKTILLHSKWDDMT